MPETGDCNWLLEFAKVPPSPCFGARGALWLGDADTDWDRRVACDVSRWRDATLWSQGTDSWLQPR